MSVLRRGALAAAALAACAAPAAPAAASGRAVSPAVAAAAARAGAAATVVPHELPPAGRRAASAVTRTWLVGARPGAAARRVAVRFGARAAGPWGTFVVDARRARGFAAALRGAGAYVSAEPDRPATLHASVDPLTAAWRDAVVRADLAPPAVTAATPLVALIDSQLDPSHPEFAGSNVVTTGAGIVEDAHGTATAGIASAPVNGVGIEGIWPNARTVNLPTTLSCGDLVERIAQALALGARVLNMSYGSSTRCRAEAVALQAAAKRGVLLVAAAGNEFTQGNPLEFPASLPHVLTVAAAATRTQGAYFSNANVAIDLAAPGAGVLTTVPPAFDEDGTADGYAMMTGTSFAAPIVAGAAAWLSAARPDLDAHQLQQALRTTADDMDQRGWDVRTGWGFLDLAGALTQATPRRDPGEPNDELGLIDGTIGPAAAPVFRSTARSARLDASIDLAEDPRDAYRIVVPARASVRVSVTPRFGNPDLAVFSRSARSLDGSRGRVARSSRGTGRTDSVVVRNGSRISRVFYVDVRPSPTTTTLNAGYRLTVTRR